MIEKQHWKMLEKANRMLALDWQTLKDARSKGNVLRIQRAELNYFQALQSVFNAAENAVAQRGLKPKPPN